MDPVAKTVLAHTTFSKLRDSGYSPSYIPLNEYILEEGYSTTANPYKLCISY